MTTIAFGEVSRRWPRVAYGVLFAVFLPALLAIWSLRLDELLRLPDLRAPVVGAVLVAAGVVLMLAAIHALWVHGRGLPMSPFPPERLVTRGAYRLVPHPIYVGAVMTTGGTALAIGSAAGLLIVTPVLALAAISFVIGYEREATLARFGTLPRPLLRLPPLSRAVSLWRWVCRVAEWIANSWRELSIGPVRFLSHGLYASAAVLVGSLLAVTLTGSAHRWWIVGLILAGEVGAALWAQIVEGSPQLLRPYGYFGGVAAVVLLTSAAGLAGFDGWLLIAAVLTGGCFGQAIGRLRCLVQGCCHGRPIDRGVGIRFTHPRSRVVRLSGLEGIPLHPTQLYSMVATLVTGFVLLRLWIAGAPLPFITGMYFVLIGLGRFAEEHFRGEPQTPSVYGLRLYQWLAIGFVVAGAAATMIRGATAPTTSFDVAAVPLMIGLAVVTYVAYGVDFPRSSRRFSRLV